MFVVHFENSLFEDWSHRINIPLREKQKIRFRILKHFQLIFSHVKKIECFRFQILNS